MKKQNRRNQTVLFFAVSVIAPILILFGIPIPHFAGFALATFFPGYLISSAFFRSRFARIVFSPALSVALLVVPLITLNSVLNVLLTRQVVSLLVFAVFAFSSVAWHRFSKPSKKEKLPRTLLLILLLVFAAISVPAALNGTPDDKGIRYGGNFDNDPWMHQAYANRLLIEKDLPIHDPFVGNVEQPRFYHYGFHVYMLALHYFTNLRFFQILQMLSLFLPLWFVLSSYFFLRNFLKEKTSLLATFLFVFGGGFGGILLALQALGYLQHGLASLPSFMLSNNEMFRCPIGICSLDILYLNNLPFGHLIITQSAGFVYSLFLFPFLYLLLSKKPDIRNRILLSLLFSIILLSHFVTGVILFLSSLLYFVIKTTLSGFDAPRFAYFVDSFLISGVVFAAYYIKTTLLHQSVSPSFSILPFFKGNLIFPVAMMFGIMFIIGLPNLFYVAAKKKTEFILLMASIMIVTLLFVTRTIPISAFVIRNYSIRLMFIPLIVSFTLFLERKNIIRKRAILVPLILVLSASNIINTAAYYYVVLSDKDTISYQEWDALEWIRNSTDPDSVFLSSEYLVGPYGKIPAFTGRKILIGGASMWFYDNESVTNLKNLVDDLYTNNVTQSTIETLKEYGIDYIYIGPSEKRKYGEFIGNGFEPFFRKVFHNNETDIFLV